MVHNLNSNAYLICDDRRDDILTRHRCEMNQFPILPIQRTSEGDILQYSIYPVYPDVNLKNVLDYTLDLMSTWTDNYIWNLDPFNLTLDPSVPRLHGSMDLGEDSGASPDEWIVVGVFWQVSKRFHDIVIRCHAIRT